MNSLTASRCHIKAYQDAANQPPKWPLLTIESPVAQWLEHPTRSQRVVGSNPIWCSDFFRVLQTFNLSCVCCFIFNTCILTLEVGWLGRASQESWVMVWGPIPKTLNLIYEQNLWLLPPYLWPGQKFDTLFMTIVPGTVTGAKRLKTHTFWGCMHLYSPYKGATPPGSFHPWASKFHFEFFSTEGYPETLLQAHNLRTLKSVSSEPKPPPTFK